MTTRVHYCNSCGCPNAIDAAYLPADVCCGLCGRDLSERAVAGVIVAPRAWASVKAKKAKAVDEPMMFSVKDGAK